MSQAVVNSKYAVDTVSQAVRCTAVRYKKCTTEAQQRLASLRIKQCEYNLTTLHGDGREHTPACRSLAGICEQHPGVSAVARPRIVSALQ